MLHFYQNSSLKKGKRGAEYWRRLPQWCSCRINGTSPPSTSLAVVPLPGGGGVKNQATCGSNKPKCTDFDKQSTSWKVDVARLRRKRFASELCAMAVSPYQILCFWLWWFYFNTGDSIQWTKAFQDVDERLPSCQMLWAVSVFMPSWRLYCLRVFFFFKLNSVWKRTSPCARWHGLHLALEQIGFTTMNRNMIVIWTVAQPVVRTISMSTFPNRSWTKPGQP